MNSPTSNSGHQPAVSHDNAVGRRSCLAVLCLFFLLFSLILSVPTILLPLYRMAAARTWEAVPCVILASELETELGEAGSGSRVRVRYEYRRDGKRYEGDRFSFVNASSSFRRWKERRLRQYPAGSEKTCFVHPHHSHRSVLERGPTPDLWFGLVPLAFVVLGIVGFLWSIGRLWHPSMPAPRSWRPKTHQRRSDTTLDWAKDASNAGFSTSHAAAADTVVLSARASPVARVLAMLAFAVFWNGIVGTLVYTRWNEWSGHLIDWFLLVFFLPFVLIGFVVIVAFVHSLLTLLNPRPILSLSPSEPRLGDELVVSWRWRGRTDSVRTFKISLEGKEITRYRRGTETHTDQRSFANVAIVETDRPGQVLSGSEQFLLPRDTMHSLDAPHNKIVWCLRVTGEISSWPDIDESFLIPVLPLASGK